jgi:hypothetical protein
MDAATESVRYIAKGISFGDDQFHNENARTRLPIAITLQA